MRKKKKEIISYESNERGPRLIIGCRDIKHDNSVIF